MGERIRVGHARGIDVADELDVAAERNGRYLPAGAVDRSSRTVPAEPMEKAVTPIPQRRPTQKCPNSWTKTTTVSTTRNESSVSRSEPVASADRIESPSISLRALTAPLFAGRAACAKARACLLVDRKSLLDGRRCGQRLGPRASTLLDKARYVVKPDAGPP